MDIVLQKVRKRMKNEKGLTLVELLAVLVILGIIAAIAVPAIGNILQKSKEDAVKAEALQVINAAKLYVAAEGIPEGTTPLNVVKDDDSAGDLSPYLEEFDNNTGTDGASKKDYKVTVTKTDDGVKYTISSKAITAGKVTITFNGATVKDINDDKENKPDNGAKTIPPTAGG